LLLQQLQCLAQQLMLLLLLLSCARDSATTCCCYSRCSVLSSSCCCLVGPAITFLQAITIQWLAALCAWRIKCFKGGSHAGWISLLLLLLLLGA
jgi:hypothetical protein